MSISALLRAERGNFAVTLGLAALPVMLAAGIALEYTQAARYDSRLQNAVDAATLAAGYDLQKKRDAQVRADLQNHLRSNLEAGDYAQLKNLDIAIDRKQMAITVDATGSMKTSFARLVRRNKLDYHVSASIQAAWGAIEAVLVLDNTGSMSWDGKLAALKTVAGDFVDGLLAYNSTGSRVKVGLAPFSEYVNVGAANASATWLATPVPPGWQGCVGSRANPLDLGDTAYGVKIPPVADVTCPAALTDLTDNGNLLDSRIAAMVPVGATYIPSGLVWGQRMLSSKAPLTAASTALVARRDRITKAIILMTDGENTISANAATPYHDGRDIAAANVATATLCEAVKKDGYLLFTITFGTGVPPATQQLLANCSNGEGYYFDANTGADLKKSFDEIAQKLTRLYLTH